MVIVRQVNFKLESIIRAAQFMIKGSNNQKVLIILKFQFLSFYKFIICVISFLILNKLSFVPNIVFKILYYFSERIFLTVQFPGCMSPPLTHCASVSLASFQFLECINSQGLCTQLEFWLLLILQVSTQVTPPQSTFFDYSDSPHRQQKPSIILHPSPVFLASTYHDFKLFCFNYLFTCFEALVGRACLQFQHVSPMRAPTMSCLLLYFQDL